jgi:hypothetical protein
MLPSGAVAWGFNDKESSDCIIHICVTVATADGKDASTAESPSRKRRRIESTASQEKTTAEAMSLDDDAPAVGGQPDGTAAETIVVHAHRIIVGGHSAVFKAMLLGVPMKEKDDRTAVLACRDAQQQRAAYDMLQWCYTGTLQSSNGADLVEVLLHANHYLIAALRQACANALIGLLDATVTELNACRSSAQWPSGALDLAVHILQRANIIDWPEPSVLDSAAKVVGARFGRLEHLLASDSEWKQFTALSVPVVSALLASDYVGVASENAVFQTARLYLKAQRSPPPSIDERLQLLKTIRFCNMTRQFLRHFVIGSTVFCDPKTSQDVRNATKQHVISMPWLSAVALRFHLLSHEDQRSRAIAKQGGKNSKHALRTSYCRDAEAVRAPETTLSLRPSDLTVSRELGTEGTIGQWPMMVADGFVFRLVLTLDFKNPDEMCVFLVLQERLQSFEPDLDCVITIKGKLAAAAAADDDVKDDDGAYTTLLDRHLLLELSGGEGFGLGPKWRWSEWQKGQSILSQLDGSIHLRATCGVRHDDVWYRD